MPRTPTTSVGPGPEISTFGSGVDGWRTRARCTVGTVRRAAGEPEPFDAALAVDGIDEHLANLPFILSDEELAGAGETLHLHCTDRDGEWLLRRTADGLEVTPEHAKGDIALRGTASDLYLVVLGRTPAAEPDIFGDPDAYETWKPLLGF